MSTEVKEGGVDEKQVAIQAIEYLMQHGLCLSWGFHEEHPPSEEVRKFLLGEELEIVAPRYGEENVVEFAIETIEEGFGYVCGRRKRFRRAASCRAIDSGSPQIPDVAELRVEVVAIT